MLRASRLLALLATGTGAALGCGSGGAGLFDPCNVDDDCNGDLVCVGDTCLEPSARGEGGASGAGDSGTGGAGEGGTAASAGVGGTGGLGATGGAAGSGGSGGSLPRDASVPDATGAGGTGGTPDAGMEELPPFVPGIGAIGCGEGLICSAGSELCCYDPPGGFTPSNHDCAGSCGSGDIDIECDGHEDCPGQLCCRRSGSNFPFPTSPSFGCEDSCSSAEIGCGGPQNCAVGQTCCGEVTTGGFPPTSRVTRTACTTDCSGADRTVLCLEDSHCPPGTTCGPSSSLEGFRLCS